MRVSVSKGKEYIISFLLAKSPEMFQEAVSEIKLYNTLSRNHGVSLNKFITYNIEAIKISSRCL